MTKDKPAKIQRIVGGILIAGLMALTGLYYLKGERVAARSVAQAQLGSIANLKATQIKHWRDERLGEARFLLQTTAVADDIATMIARPRDEAVHQRLLDWLVAIQGDARYESVTVLDPAGRLLFATSEQATPVNTTPSEAFRKALSSEDVVVVDLYRGATDARARFDLLVPIRPLKLRGNRGAPGDFEAIAVIVLRLDPLRSLFPILRDWPVPTETGEALLVRQEGDDVVYLSDLRHEPDAAVRLRRSMKDPDLPAAMGLRGHEDVREGVDYRGEAVLATGRPILGSPWVLEVKIDQREAYAAMRREVWQSVTLIVLVILSLALGWGFFSWQRRSELLGRALEAEHERALAAERLALVMRHANDIILLCDDDGRILEANHRSLATYGYTREELRAMPGGGLRAPSVAALLVPQLNTLRSQEGGVFETAHCRKDGSVLQVEVSGRSVKEGGRSFLLLIVRDITERRLADEALRASLREKDALLKEVHHRVKNNLQVITSLLRLEASRSVEPSTKVVLKDMQSRIRSMALLHEALYRTGNFARIDLAAYLGKLATQLFQMQRTESKKVRLVMDLSPSWAEIDQAVPCGLIVNELLTNCLKHGFGNGRSGEVHLAVRQAMDGEVRLQVSDDGVGIPEDFEAKSLKSLGLQLVTDLTRQIGGRLEVGPAPRAMFVIVFRPHGEASHRLRLASKSDGGPSPLSLVDQAP
jgi:PAS domain S-box-containing protein